MWTCVVYTVLFADLFIKAIVDKYLSDLISKLTLMIPTFNKSDALTERGQLAILFQNNLT